MKARSAYISMGAGLDLRIDRWGRGEHMPALAAGARFDAPAFFACNLERIMTLPLMPKATAVWLIEKTALTFTQIADFCGMHPLEVQAIADGEVAQGIVGYDPVANGQVTAGEIKRCEADPERAAEACSRRACRCRSGRAGARYTPVAKRNDRPDAHRLPAAQLSRS